MVMDLGCDTFMETLFDNTGQPIFTIYSKTEARKQGYSDPEMVNETP